MSFTKEIGQLNNEIYKYIKWNKHERWYEKNMFNEIRCLDVR